MNDKNSQNDVVSWLWRYGAPMIAGAILIADIYITAKKLQQRSKTENSSMYAESFSADIGDLDIGVNLNSFLLKEKPKVAFNDIGGLDEVKEVLRMEVIYPKIKSELYSLYNKKPGCGILLFGPPGCGKTDHPT
jgi:SpoVK/Ycf46/Vps4 family AAA+-type ATPase